METISGDPRFPIVANATAELMETAIEKLGLEVDVVCCLVAQVAADFARGQYGDAYLRKLADVVLERAIMTLPVVQRSADEVN
ncbi:MAG: hypothetical protein EON56_05520 [Alphaproteobacteria bacterium]|nr:MAG: hypothetical protein EON56_05520 [Alphaproteobacteria bacterium]